VEFTLDNVTSDDSDWLIEGSDAPLFLSLSVCDLICFSLFDSIMSKH